MCVIVMLMVAEIVTNVGVWTEITHATQRVYIRACMREALAEIAGYSM